MTNGLKFAADTFWRALEVTFSSVKRQFALIYVNDLAVFSNTVEQHLNQLQGVLKLQQHTGVTPKPEKCSFSVETINYFALIIR